MDLSKVSRVEVIDGMGRVYTNWEVGIVDLQLQDDERTLKVFIYEDEMEKPIEHRKRDAKDELQKLSSFIFEKFTEATGDCGLTYVDPYQAVNVMASRLSTRLKKERGENESI